MEGKGVRSVFTLALILFFVAFANAVTIIDLDSPVNNSNLSSNSVLFNGTVNPTNASAGVKNVSLYLDGVLNVNNSAGLNSTNYTFIVSVADGNHNWFYQACDILDDCVNSPTGSFLVDTIFPSVDSVYFSNMYFDGSNYYFSPANQDGNFDYANISINASEFIVDWGTVFIHNTTNRIDRFNADSGINSFWRNESWDGHFSSSYGNAALFVPDGEYTINTTFIDVAGNENVSVFVGSVFVDNTAPIANMVSPTNGSMVFGIVNLSANTSDLGGTQSVSFNVNGVNYPASLIGSEWIATINTSIFTDGFYFVNVTATDNVNNANTSTIAQILINNGMPQILNSSPSENEIIIKQNQSQTFDVTAVDFGGDALTYSWFFDGILNGTNTSSYIFQTQSIGSFNITVIVSDIGGNEVAREWSLISTVIPVASSFTGNSTTNLSAIVNLSNVVNFTLENSAGKIVFSDAVDLTNVLDIDGSVIIQNGIIAINTTQYPQLNKNATITLFASYNSVPEILYTNSFTNVSSQINQGCEFCDILNYTNFPTLNGEITFEVEHFSSFFVTGSGEEIDLSLLTGLATCISGIQGDIDISLNDPENNEEIEVGDFLEVEADVEISGEQGKEIVFKAILFNVDENDDKEEKSKIEKINENDEEEFELSLEISEDIDENDNYILYVKAYEKGNQENECSEGAIFVDVERERHSVVVKELTMSPYAFLGENLNVGIEVENIGTSDEDVYVVLSVPEMGINIVSEIFELEEFDEDDRAFLNMTIRVPENFEQGKYDLKARVVFDDGFSDADGEFSAFKKTVLSSSSGETTITSASSNNINGEFYQQFDTANKYLVWMIFVTLVLTLLVAVFRGR